MMKHIGKIGVLLAVLWGNIASAQLLPQDPKLIKGKLKNGFTYYIYPHAEPKKQAVLRLFVNAGSILEEADQQGLAHFLEHMAFNGSTHFKKNELITFLESKGVKFGSDLNAHTSFDETVYKLQVPVSDPAVLKKSLTIMADWANGVLFDSLEIEKERGVVIEEWRTGQGAANRMRQHYLPVLLNNSRYAQRLPIGKTKVLETFKRERIVSFYRDWYRPDLMAIAVVGDVKPKEVEKLIQKHFAGMAAPANPKKREYYPVADHRDTLVSIVADAEATDVEFSIFKKIPARKPIQTKTGYQEFLTQLLFNRLTAERFQRLAEAKSSYRKGSLAVTNLVLTKDAVAGGASLYKDRIKEGITDYVKVQETIFRYGFTAREIEKIRKNYLLQLSQSAEGENKTEASVYLGDIQADFYKGSTMVSRADEVKLAREALPLVDSVAIIQYIRQLNTPGNVVLLFTAPDKKEIQLPLASDLKRWVAEAVHNKNIQAWQKNETVPAQLLATMPVAGKVTSQKAIKEVNATVWELSNGARVILKPTPFDHERVMLTGFRQGGIYALDSTKYITGLFAKTIIGLSGAGNFSRSTLSQYLAGNTASAQLILAENREGVAANAKVKDMETMFQLLYLKWTQPQADATLFAANKEKLVEAYENSTLSPSYEYNHAVNQLLNGSSYVSTPITAERVNKELNYEDVLPVFKERFGSAKGFTFVILGNFTHAGIKPFVEKYLASLPGTAVNTNYLYHGPDVSSKEDSVIKYAGEARKSQVNLFYQGKDFKYDYQYLVRLQLLEEVLKIKLRNNLREENGGVYGVGVAASATTKPAPLYRVRIGFTCAPEKVDFLVKQTESEIAKVAASPEYFEAELARIKKQFLETRKKAVNKSTFWSSELRNHFYYDMQGWEYFTNYEKIIQTISAKDLARDANLLLVQRPLTKTILMPKVVSNP